MFRILAVLAWLPALGLAQWGYPGWMDSTRVYINTTATGANTREAVANFPLLVRLDSGNFDFSRAQATGADLFFTDPDGTLLYHEMELFDPAAKRAALWVRVPQVEPQSLTEHIVMRWNNPAAFPMSNPAAVFDAAEEYAAVWHFSEDAAGTGTRGAFKDATWNANHGDDYASAPRALSAIGFGREFDGLDDRVTVPNSPSLALAGPLSLSAWVRADALAPTSETNAVVNPIIRKGDDNPNSYQLAAYDGKVAFILDADEAGGLLSASELQVGKFHHVAATLTGSSIRIYIDGMLDAEGASPVPAGALTKDARPVHIGGRVMGIDPHTQDRWDGHIDEVRIARRAHSSDHVKLSYETQKQSSAVLAFRPFTTSPLPGVKLTDWAHSRRIVLNTTSEGAGVAGTVTAFPLLVRLDAGLFPFDQAKPGGADLRFTDPDGTFLPYAIERWDGAAQKAEVWVKVPEVEGNSGTDHIRMHWGNLLAAPDENPAAVFDTADGFAGVWHLDEPSPGRPGTAAYQDRTANKNHGRDYAAAEAAEALIGRGQRFGGAQDYIAVPAHASLDLPSAFTFSAWVKGSVWDTAKTVVSPVIRKGGQVPNAYQLSLDAGHVNLILNDYDGNGVNGAERLDTGAWYHVAATWMAGTAQVFVNGKVSATAATGMAPPIKDARPLFIGGRDTTGGGSDQFNGDLDEIQVSRVVRSRDWVKLAYESQKAKTRLLWHEGYEGRLPPRETPADPPRTAWTYDTTLAPGDGFGKDGVFRIQNPTSSPVRVKITPAGDSAAPGVIGVEAIIRITAPGTDGLSTILAFTLDSSVAAGRSLYRLLPGVEGHGRLADLGGAAGTTDLNQEGDYIVAKDTSAPVIRILGEGVGESDSSWIRLRVEDNIQLHNLICFTTGADGAGSSRRKEEAGIPFRYAFHPEPGILPLKIFVSADDGRHQTAFPAPPASAYALERALPELSIPVTSGEPLAWSLFGLPARPAQSPTLEALAKASGAGRLRAAAWKPSPEDSTKGEYVFLEGRDTLPAGVGLWLAGESRFGSLPMGPARTLSQASGTAYALSLRRGWNQITSPALEKLPWVVSLSDLPAYDRSPVKGLHAWNSEGGYRDADTLEPFRGYFVFSRADTTLALGPERPAAAGPAPKGAAQVSLGVLLEPLAGADGHLPAAAVFRLGAAAYAVDGLGPEDEPMPSAPGRSGGLVAARSGRGLRSDVTGLRPGGLHAWKLAWSGRGDPPREGRMRVSALDLPSGMVLRAASASASDPVELAAGSEIPLSGLPGDTLVLWAAPPGAWRPGDPIPELAPRPLRLAVAFQPGPDGADLVVALPEAAGLRAAVHTADGRRWAFLERARLAPGRHAFRLGKALPRGLLFVTLEFPGAKGLRRLVLTSVDP